MKNVWFFARTSWQYLGCSQGRGRWRARRLLLRKGWASYRTFRALQRRDQELEKGLHAS